MTRIVVAARPEAAAPIRALLESLPGAAVQVGSTLGELPWSSAGALWIHDLRPDASPLLPWLTSGGRLLATLEAALLPSDLGIESIAPDDLRESTWDAASVAEGPFGMAAFGDHPLFAGLQRGAETSSPTPGEVRRRACYLAGRPREGRVVAVERLGDRIDAARLVAWEYPVGQGGILCIGAHIRPEAAEPKRRPQLLALLGNALGGDGIPGHRPRTAPRYWPAPGATALRHDMQPVPDLPELEDRWPTGGGSKSEFPANRPAGRWALPGRRALLAGDSRGLGELWVHPWRAARDIALHVRGMAPATAEPHLSPVGAERHSLAGAVSVVERWLVALEHPIAYWDVQADEGAPLLLEWTSDLRPSPPFPPASAGDLELSVAPDGRRAVVGASGDPFRLVVDVAGATLEAAPVEGPGVRFSVRGAGRCRVRFTGATDQADLSRSHEVLTRRGLPGLLRQRGDHARELSTYATSVEVPERSVVEGIERAKLAMDSLLAGSPGVGRSLLGTLFPGNDGEASRGHRFGGAEACGVAIAQLALGDRAGPRDLLKFLSLTQDVDGRIAAGCSTSGVVVHGVEAVVPAYLLLASRYADWTGELDFLARRWSAIRRAIECGREHGLEGPPWSTALAALQPLAESLGHLEAAEAIGEWILPGSGRPPAQPDGEAPAWPDRLRQLSGQVASAVAKPTECADLALAAVEGLWGIRSDALASAVRIAPWFPPDWERMAIERLRVGRSVLTVRMRRRFSQVVAQVERIHGPRIHVEFLLREESSPGPVQLDDVPLGGDRAAFEADGAHLLIWNR